LGWRSTEGIDAEFAAFVRRRGRHHLRTAVLLTGDWHAAEDLVQSCLVKLYRVWRRAHGLAERPRAAQIDARLHAERVDPRSRRQLTRPAPAGALPDGAMVRHRGAPGLLAGGRLLPWSFTGYLAPVTLAPATRVELLTPPATVAAIAAGYRPLLHPSTAAAGSARLLPG
jgi:hypothetical protein